MEFRVLGGLELRLGDTEVDALGGRKQRLLLLSLLLEPGSARSIDQLTGYLWGDDPPTTPGASIRAYVHHLRKAIEPRRARGAKPVILVRRADGYALAIDRDNTDVGLFERDLRRARQASDPRAALEAVEAALARWRGQPFAEAADLPWAEAEVARLTRLRDDAEELRAALLIRGDRPGEAAAAIEHLIEREPYRESAVAVLATAHARAGDRAAGVRAIAAVRSRLGDDLGLEPGPELVGLEALLLTAEEVPAPGLDLEASPAGSHPEVPPSGPGPGPAAGHGNGAAGAGPVGFDLDSVGRGGRPLGRLAFVGRGEELARLARTAAAVGDGSGRAVCVSGPPGIGKTRLVEEIIGPMAARGTRVVVAHCDQGARTMTLWPWIAMLRSLLGGRDAAELDVLLGADRVTLDILVPELVEPAAGSPAGSPVGSSAGSDDGSLLRTFDAVARLIGRAAAGEDLALVVEDLHWADGASLDLLAYLVPRLAATPVLLVVTARNEVLDDPRVAQLRTAPDTESVELEPLDPTAVEDLVRSRVDRVDVTDLASAVAQRSAGNPLFAVQLLRGIGDDDPVGRLGEATSLRTIGEVVTARLGELPEGGRDLLTAAALDGSVWSLDIVAAAAGMPYEQAMDVVEAGLAVGLLDEAPDRVGRYGFTHALVAEAIAAGLSTLARARLHARLGRETERRRAGSGTEVMAQLARHYCAGAVAGSALQAVPWVSRVAWLAMDRFDPASAEALAVGGLEALAQSPVPDRPDDLTRGRIELLLVESHALRRRAQVVASHERAIEAFELARTIDDVDWMADAAVTYGGNSGFGNWFGYWIDYQRSAELIETTLAHPGAVDLPIERRVGLLVMLADARHDGFRDGVAATVGAEAADLARTLGDPALVIETLGMYQLSAQFSMSGEERLALGREIVSRSRAAGLVVEELGGLRILLAEAIDRCDRVEVDAHLAAVDDLARRTDHPLVVFAAHWIPLAFSVLFEPLDVVEAGIQDGLARFAHLEERRLDILYYLYGQVFRWQDGLDAVREVYEERLREQPSSTWRSVLVMLHAQEGRFGVAQEMLDSMGDDEFLDIEDSPLQFLAPTMAADAVADLGDVRRAEQLISLLEPHADRLVNFYLGMQYWNWVDHHLGRLKMVVGRLDEACHHLTTARAKAERLGAPLLVAQCDVALADLAHALRRQGRSPDFDEPDLEALAARAETTGHHLLARRARQAAGAAAVG